MHMYNSTTDLIFILKGDRKSNQIIRKDYLCMLIVSVVTAVYIFLFKNNYNDVPTIIMLEEELLEENGALSCMPPGMPQAYNGIIGIWHSSIPLR